MGATANVRRETLSDAAAWKALALSFPCISRMVSGERIPTEFTAQTLIDLRGISTAERSVCAFLLHVWNKYDNAFELPELQGWDQRHQEAFAAWVDGRTLGRPLRYF